MAYGTVNADVIGTSVANSNLGAGNATNFKNRIINGAMVIDQRNAGASVTITTANPTYTLDRWAAYGSVTSKYTVQQNAASVTPPTGFSNYLGATSSAATSVGSTDYYYLRQAIEGFNSADLGWGTANAKTVTLSFQVYSSLTGTFGGGIRNNANNYCYPFSYTISSANTWTSISVTIAGPTSGTWIGSTNGVGMDVNFSLGTGTTYSGTAGAWAVGNFVSVTGATSVVGTNGATFYITGVQLEVGSSATGFDYRDFTSELSMCQRYYQQIGGNSFNGNPLYPIIGNGFAFNTSQVDIFVPLRTTMRTTPTTTSSGTVIQVIAAAYTITSIGDVGSTYNGMFFRISTSGTFVAGMGAEWTGNNSTSSYAAFSAEL
jgi:hypothetical protein